MARQKKALNSDFHCGENLRWKVYLSAAKRPLNYHLRLDCVGERVDPGDERVVCVKKNGSDASIK
jgi:hypothetical protein